MPQPEPGPAVHDERRLAVRVAARLPVDEVAVADVEHPVVVRLDRRERLHLAENLSLRNRAIGQAPLVVLDSTVYVTSRAGSWTL